MNSIVVNTNIVKSKVEELNNVGKYYSGKKSIFRSGAFNSSSSLATYLTKIGNIYEAIADNIGRVSTYLGEYCAKIEAEESKWCGKSFKSSNVDSANLFVIYNLNLGNTSLGSNNSSQQTTQNLFEAGNVLGAAGLLSLMNGMMFPHLGGATLNSGGSSEDSARKYYATASGGTVGKTITSGVKDIYGTGEMQGTGSSPSNVTNGTMGSIINGVLEGKDKVTDSPGAEGLDTILKDTNVNLGSVMNAMAFLSLARENMGKDVNGYWDVGIKCMKSEKNAMKEAEMLYEKEREEQERQVTDYVNALYESESSERLKELVLEAQNREEVRRYLESQGINITGAENNLEDKELITKIILGAHAVNRQEQLKNEVMASNSEYKKYGILSKMLSSVIQNVGPINTGRGEVIYLSGRDNSFWSGLSEEEGANQAYKDLVGYYAEVKAGGYDDILKLFSGLVGSEVIASLEKDYKTVQVGNTVIDGKIDNLGGIDNSNGDNVTNNIPSGDVSVDASITEITQLLKQVILDRNKSPEAIQAYYQAIRDCMKVEEEALKKAEEWYITVSGEDAKYISDYVNALYQVFDDGGKEKLVELINQAKGLELGIDVNDALTRIRDKEFVTMVVTRINAQGRILNYKEENLKNSAAAEKAKILEVMISSTIQYKGKLDLGSDEFLNISVGRDNSYWSSVSESEAYKTAYKDLVESYFVAKQKGYNDILEKYEKAFGSNIIKSLDSDYQAMLSKGMTVAGLDYLGSIAPIVKNDGVSLGDTLKGEMQDKIEGLDDIEGVQDNLDSEEKNLSKEEIYAKIGEVDDFVYMVDTIGYANLKDEDFEKANKYIEVIQNEAIYGVLGSDLVNVYMKSLNRIKQIKDYREFISGTLVNSYASKFGPYVSVEAATKAGETVEFCNAEEFAKLGFDSEVIGYNDGKKSYVNIEGNPTNINYTNISHELLHQLSYKENVQVGEYTVDKQGLCLGTQYGGLSEAVTEYFNEMIVGDNYPGTVYSGYHDAVKRIKELISLGILDDEMLIRGYFSEDTRNMDDLVNAFYKLDEGDGWSIVTDLFDEAVSSDMTVRNNALAKLDGMIENWKLKNS